MAVDVDLGQVGQLGLLGLVNGLKPFPHTIQLLQITEPYWLRALKATSGIFGLSLILAEKKWASTGRSRPHSLTHITQREQSKSLNNLLVIFAILKNYCNTISRNMGFLYFNRGFIPFCYCKRIFT